MEILDGYITTLVLLVLLGIAITIIISMYRTLTHVEYLLELEHKNSSYYSKESLDRMEQVFELRKRLLDAQLEIKKLQSKE